MTLIYVALGGAVGAMLRYLTGVFMLHRMGAHFPYGTLTVNIVGSLLMGLLMGYLLHHHAHKEVLHTLLAVGLLGGFTTFSAFSFDVMAMMQRGEMMSIAIYMFASIAGGIAAVLLGMILMRAVCV